MLFVVKRVFRESATGNFATREQTILGSWYSLFGPLDYKSMLQWLFIEHHLQGTGNARRVRLWNKKKKENYWFFDGDGSLGGEF